MTAAADRADSETAPQTSGWARFHPTVWHTPADQAAHNAALQSSTQQIEDSFGTPWWTGRRSADGSGPPAQDGWGLTESVVRLIVLSFCQETPRYCTRRRKVDVLDGRVTRSRGTNRMGRC